MPRKHDDNTFIVQIIAADGTRILDTGTGAHNGSYRSMSAAMHRIGILEGQGYTAEIVNRRYPVNDD